MNILKLFILATFGITLLAACSETTSVYKDTPSGYHRNEYNHRHGNAPPVPDQNQLPPQK